MYLYFKGLQTLGEKRKYNLLHLLRQVYIEMLLIGCLRKCSYYLLLSVCAFVVYVCAFVGVTFLKTQHISPMPTLNT